MHIELRKDMFQVLVHRPRSNHQPFSNLLVGETLGHELEHL